MERQLFDPQITNETLITSFGIAFFILALIAFFIFKKNKK